MDGHGSAERPPGSQAGPGRVVQRRDVHRSPGGDVAAIDAGHPRGCDRSVAARALFRPDPAAHPRGCAAAGVRAGGGDPGRGPAAVPRRGQGCARAGHRGSPRDAPRVGIADRGSGGGSLCGTGSGGRGRQDQVSLVYWRKLPAAVFAELRPPASPCGWQKAWFLPACRTSAAISAELRAPASPCGWQKAWFLPACRTSAAISAELRAPASPCGWQKAWFLPACRASAAVFAELRPPASSRGCPRWARQTAPFWAACFYPFRFNQLRSLWISRAQSLPTRNAALDVGVYSSPTPFEVRV